MGKAKEKLKIKNLEFFSNFHLTKSERKSNYNESSKHGFGRLSNAGCTDQRCSSGPTATTSCCGLCIPYGSTKSGITLFETINTSNLNNKLTKGFNKQYPNTYSDPEWHTPD